jgi:hypothetical protein
MAKKQKKDGPKDGLLGDFLQVSSGKTMTTAS